MHESPELLAALDAAREGAECVRQYASRHDVAIRKKGPRDLVTDADVATEALIIERLLEQFPDDRILGEETAGPGWSPQGRWWIIDPIDGTTNFAHGFPLYCVSVAFWEDGAPVAGVVLEVNRGEEFCALAGHGAWCDGRPIRVSDETELSQAVIGTGFPYTDFRSDEPYLELFKEVLHGCRSVRRPGAGTYDLCSVAAGRFDGFYEYGLQPWDVAAAALIAREAGAVVTDWRGSQEWLFAKRMVAANPAMHRVLMELVERHIPRSVRLGPD